MYFVLDEQQNSYAGNAVGFKLSALQQLTDLRANKPRMTLLHYIVDIAENENAALLEFTQQLMDVKEARRFNLEALVTEVAFWRKQVTQIEREISDADEVLRDLMNGTLPTPN